AERSHLHHGHELARRTADADRQDRAAARAHGPRPRCARRSALARRCDALRHRRSGHRIRRPATDRPCGARPQQRPGAHLRHHARGDARGRRAAADATARSRLRSGRVGVHGRAVGARHGCVSRSRAALGFVSVRIGRCAPPGSARPAAERPRQRRHAQAWRCAGGDSPPLGAPRGRIRRSGAVVDAEGRLGRPLGRGGTADPLMRQLSLTARVYVGGIIAAGAALFVAVLPHVHFQQPLLFLGLLILSSVSAAMKVSLPLTSGGSTMSVSYAVDFASLLLIGPHETMFVAAGSAFCQCHVNSKERNPGYRTLFSIASLVITVQAAGFAFHALGGAETTSPTLTTLARPLVAAATLYFLLNTGLIATAIALTTRQPIFSTWNNNFLWSAPSYFVGAGTAAIAAWFIAHAGYWLPFTFAPVYLTYRTYKVYMGRIEDEQRHLQQTSDLHLATIEALARAIDAKDQTTQMHIRRVQVYAAGLARAAGLSDA